MEILRYSDLDVRGLEAPVERATALLDTVRLMLDPLVKRDLMAERYNFMGSIAAMYILTSRKHSPDPATSF
jgi:hypothetical protein